MTRRNKNAGSPSQLRENTADSKNCGAEFPSARYFQVHLQYLEDLLNQTRQGLEALKLQIENFYRDPRREKNKPPLAVPRAALALRFESTAAPERFGTGSEPHTSVTQRKPPPGAFVTQSEVPPEG